MHSFHYTAARCGTFMFNIIFRFGPLVRHWTMRYEARHSYFKKLAQNIGNYINISWTLANRHQLLQCYYHTTQDYFLSDAVDIGPGIPFHSTDAQIILHFNFSFTSNQLLLAGVTVAVRDRPTELQSATACFRCADMYFHYYQFPSMHVCVHMCAHSIHVCWHIWCWNESL